MSENSQNMPAADSLQQSMAYRNAPHLSSWALTTTLTAMCLIPIVLISVMFIYLPEVHEGELQASVSAVGLPPASFYETEYYQRPSVPTGELVIHNDSDQDWTHLNIQVNKHYQIYEREPIPAGQSRYFKLDRFVTRTGATFDLRYNPLKYVRIYARRPTKDRATFSSEFDWKSVE